MWTRVAERKVFGPWAEMTWYLQRWNKSMSTYNLYGRIERCSLHGDRVTKGTHIEWDRTAGRQTAGINHTYKIFSYWIYIVLEICILSFAWKSSSAPTYYCKSVSRSQRLPCWKSFFPCIRKLISNTQIRILIHLWDFRVIVAQISILNEDCSMLSWVCFLNVFSIAAKLKVVFQRALDNKCCTWFSSNFSLDKVGISYLMMTQSLTSQHETSTAGKAARWGVKWHVSRYWIQALHFLCGIPNRILID